MKHKLRYIKNSSLVLMNLNAFLDISQRDKFALKKIYESDELF